jgi:hypothetical protein
MVMMGFYRALAGFGMGLSAGLGVRQNTSHGLPA